MDPLSLHVIQVRGNFPADHPLLAGPTNQFTVTINYFLLGYL